MLLHDLILDWDDVHADRTALLHGATAVSYGDLTDQVRRAAASFLGLGIRPGDRIAVFLNKRIEAVVAYFAATLCGGIFVPVSSVLKATQVRHILDDCAVSVLVTSAAQAKVSIDIISGCSSLNHIVLVDNDGLDEGNTQGVSVQAWAEITEISDAGFCLPRRVDNDIAAILYTSGSTGKPKGVILSHRNMVTGAITVAKYIENTADDVILAALPFSFDAGFSQMTTGFSVGASVVLMDYLLPQDVLKAAARYRATGLTGVPPLWNQLAKHDWPQAAVDSLRYFANTGGAMPTATLEKLRTALPKATPFLMYGLTESFRSTYLPPEEVDKRPTSIGKAIPNAEVLVVREDGSLCDPGEPGELVHRGALVSLGYWNDPERTAARFKPLPNQPKELPFPEMTVWSGDTVVKDEDGFLYFVGRKDDMIKSSGYRISPTEIEETIYNTGLVTECAAIGIPDPDIGQAVVVVAHCAEPTDAAAAEVIEACKRELPTFMVPAAVVWRDRLPKNPNGKIDRRKLNAELQDADRAEA